MTLLTQARANLRKQLDWRGPNSKAQGILTLARDQAEAVLAGPTDPVAVLDEIGRLALLVNKAEVEAYADAGGMKPRHRRFTCKGCGADWMTVLPDVETCQQCFNIGQPDMPKSRQSRGSKGGKARAEVLSPERRKEIATAAAKARWG
jgi:hypothetical protein